MTLEVFQVVDLQVFVVVYPVQHFDYDPLSNDGSPSLMNDHKRATKQRILL